MGKASICRRLPRNVLAPLVFLYRNVEGKKTLLGLGSVQDTSLTDDRATPSTTALTPNQRDCA
jgi:hypothetical protein